MNESITPTARGQLLAAMQARPDDFWPRGIGHVVLAMPGSREEEKAYHEPGGGFSPSLGSFGVSIWVLDENDQIIATSDTIPLEEIEQNLKWDDDGEFPILETLTPFYDAAWEVNGNRCFLRIAAQRGNGRLAVVIRSAGPCGEPIYSLQYGGKHMEVNQRWLLNIVDETNVQVFLASENEADWSSSRSDRNVLVDETGWACARIEIPSSIDDWVLEIIDHTPREDSKKCYRHIPSSTNLARSSIEIDLPDARFAECLQAQVANLMMGIVRDETRPGDPNNYPLNWQRDGAYIIVALARAGQIDVAKVLCKPYAERDFFGGFGSEADAPGLALWAMDEVVSCLPHSAQSTFIQENWPHIHRKAELLITMLETKRPMHVPPFGPIVPQHINKPDFDLVCEPSLDGLINGRMDWHRPLLYINAVAFRGLLGAASWAERMEQSTLATRWHEYATRIQTAWGKALNKPEHANERNAICGLWPSDIATPFIEAYRAQLEERFQSTYEPDGTPRERPLWTYFNIAEAHQWMRLGEVERAWQIVEWFWRHQSSPGLWTWWEGNREENSFGVWQQARGWAQPDCVTPHYWTAAEMLALQIEMLVSVDRSNAKPILTIGAGVRGDWLAHPMKVQGVPTVAGIVDWEWNPTTRELGVTLHDSSNQSTLERVEIRPGAAFAQVGYRMQIRNAA